MKEIRTDHIGGMPMTQYTIEKLQEGYTEMFTALVSYLGVNPQAGKYIIQGCEISGGNITSGWVFIDGFVLPFSGSAGDADTKIAMSTSAEAEAFADTVQKPLYYTYTAVVDENGTKISDFTRIPSVPVINPGTVIDPAFGLQPPQPSIWERIEKLESQCSVFQAGGGMVFWNKPANEIPNGWQEVVNWRGRIPVGFDNNQTEFNQMGKQGGGKAITLTAQNMPQHDHAYVFAQGSAGAIGNNYESTGISQVTLVNNNLSELDQDAGPDGQRLAAFTARTGKTGTNNPDGISIMNPYRVVMFIEYIG